MVVETETMYFLPESVRKSLLDYLQHRPYAEVAGGISMLQQLEVASEAAQKDD